MNQESQELFTRMFAEELHSFRTNDNTNFSRQIGKGKKIQELQAKLTNIPENCRYPDATVTAFELKSPTPDDRISLQFMPPDSCMRCNATFFCVPRDTWLKIVR